MQVSVSQKRVRRALLMALAMTTLAVPATPLVAQQAVPAISEEKMTAYAKAFEAIQYAYEVGFQDQMGRTHDALGKAELRRQFEEKTTGILTTNGLTAEEYQRITLLISVDQVQRDAFEAAIKVVRESPTTG